MVGRLDTTRWGRAAVPLLEVLGAEGQTRFVGGCVRDQLLGRPVGDVDLATEVLPQRVLELLEAAGIKAVPTGFAHGTVTAIVEQRHFEVTTLRVDVRTDGRHARVAFTKDWEADARRRDFTLNALYADLDGTLYDPTGGAQDVRAGRVRFIGDPEARLREDYLRILRFFRFHAGYGRGAVDPEGRRACARLKDGLRTLSGERVREELFKVLIAPQSTAVLEVMDADDLFSCVLPVGVSLESYERLAHLDPSPDALRRLGALLNGAGADEVAMHLKLSKTQRRRLEAMQDRPCGSAAQWDEAGARRALYWRGREAFEDQVLLEGVPSWTSLPERWSPPTFPLTGAQVHALGVVQGPRVGEILKTLEHWWVEADFPVQETLMERLREMISSQ